MNELKKEDVLDKCQDVTEKLIQKLPVVGHILDGIKGLMALREIWDAIKNARVVELGLVDVLASREVKIALEAIKGLSESGNDPFEVIGQISANIDSIKEILVDIEKISTKDASKVEGVAKWIQSKIEWVRDKLSSLIDRVRNKVDNKFLDTVLEKVQSGLDNIADKMTDPIIRIADKLAERIENKLVQIVNGSIIKKITRDPGSIYDIKTVNILMQLMDRSDVFDKAIDRIVNVIVENIVPKLKSEFLDPEELADIYKSILLLDMYDSLDEIKTPLNDALRDKMDVFIDSFADILKMEKFDIKYFISAYDAIKKVADVSVFRAFSELSKEELSEAIWQNMDVLCDKLVDFILSEKFDKVKDVLEAFVEILGDPERPVMVKTLKSMVYQDLKAECEITRNKGIEINLSDADLQYLKEYLSPDIITNKFDLRNVIEEIYNFENDHDEFSLAASFDGFDSHEWASAEDY